MKKKESREEEGLERSKLGQEKSGLDREEARADRKEAGLDREEARADRKEAGLDREEARADRKEAGLDQEEARADRKEAGSDQEKSGLDREKAGLGQKRGVLGWGGDSSGPVRESVRKSASEQLRKAAVVLLGNFIYAVGVVAFVVPAGLITGGSTGLALFFEHWLNIPIAAFVLCFNGVMFVAGAVVMGKSFALNTLLSTFAYPLILGALQKIPQLSQLTDNPVLGTVYAGGLIGLGIGLVLREGASTGGMDIPPLILNRLFGLSIPVMLYIFDCCILVLQMFHSTGEQVLYGILVVMIYTTVLGKVLLMGKSQTQVKIVSEKYEEINEMIQNTMDRGSTLIHSVTGHCRNEQMVVLTVISNRELPKLTKLATDIDPQAFMVINQVSEVRGRGFTMKKKYDNDIK